MHLRSADKPSKSRRWRRCLSRSPIHRSGSLILGADSRAICIPNFRGLYGFTRRRWLRSGKPQRRQCSHCVGDSAADAGAVLHWLGWRRLLRCRCVDGRSRLGAGWTLCSGVCCCNMQGSRQPGFAAGLDRRFDRNLVDCTLRSFRPCKCKRGWSSMLAIWTGKNDEHALSIMIEYMLSGQGTKTTRITQTRNNLQHCIACRHTQAMAALRPSPFCSPSSVQEEVPELIMGAVFLGGCNGGTPAVSVFADRSPWLVAVTFLRAAMTALIGTSGSPSG